MGPLRDGRVRLVGLLAVGLAAVAAFPAAGQPTNAPTSPPSLTWSPTTSTPPPTYDFGNQSGSTSKTFTLTNSGGSATGALGISISPSAGPFTITSDLCTGTSLGPKKSCQVTVRYSPSGAASDSATLSTSSPRPGVTAASLTLKGTGAKDLTVGKTATPSFTRTYSWTISKSVDTSKVDIDRGGSATFNYTVAVTHDGGSDGNWQVAGTITVSNPNAFDVDGVSVSDAVDNGGSCTVTGGTNVTVPASGSADLAYACTYVSAPNPGGGTNTATATWPGFGSPNTSASGTASFDFAAASPTLVDDSVSVSDTLVGSLGTVSSTDPSPTTFTYAHTFTGDPAGTCTPHGNTATFATDSTGTTGSASQTVTVCVPQIYWANGLAAIGRANLDGTGANPNFITGAAFVDAVAVDGSHIYWSNFTTNTIGRANLDGTNPNQSFITAATDPSGVAVDGSHIYWSNGVTGTIGRANLDGTSPNQSFITGAVAAGLAVSPS